MFWHYDDALKGKGRFEKSALHYQTRRIDADCDGWHQASF